MAAMGSRPELSHMSSMKRPGLTSHLASATLFLAVTSAGLSAPEKAPATPPDRVAEMIHRFDQDGDGRLDDAERERAREILIREYREKGPPAPAAEPGGAEALRARLLEMFDRNNDGRLDEDERAEAQRFATERGFTPGGRGREELLRRFDRNGNGRIDPEEQAEIREFARNRQAAERSAGDRADRERAELENVLRSAVEANPAVLRRFDANRNGRLDDDEWTAVRRALDRAH